VATVAELSGPYGNFMISPRLGRDVCSGCFNLTNGYGRCYACAHGERWLDAMVPISYSVAGEQLHYALAGYKRLPGTPARRLALGLAALLWRHLALHEPCLARAAGVDAFTLVTTVPSTTRTGAAEAAVTEQSSQTRAQPAIGEQLGSGRRHARTDDAGRTDALAAMVAELVEPASQRYQRVLGRSSTDVAAHQFSPERFAPLRELRGESVLLIDDTWTTGANAQSAAATLKAAGAGRVAALVIGRHVNRDWGHNDRLLRDLAQPFDWKRCGLCDPTGGY
jgi:hypothetical protein